MDTPSPQQGAQTLDELRELLAKATPGDIDTAKAREVSSYYECPFCGGEGSVDGATYTNYDSHAVGVQFFGVGDGFVHNERLYRAVIAALPSLLDRAEAAERAEGREWFWRIVDASGLADLPSDEEAALRLLTTKLSAAEARADALAETLTSARGWIRHWEQDIAVGLVPTVASLTSAREELDVALSLGARDSSNKGEEQ